MVQALQRRYSPVDLVKVEWMMQGDPQYAFFTSGRNDEIEVTLVRGDERVVVQDEGWPDKKQIGPKEGRGTDGKDRLVVGRSERRKLSPRTSVCGGLRLDDVTGSSTARTGRRRCLRCSHAVPLESPGKMGRVKTVEQVPP